jgi:hypothetical protein
MVTLVAVLSPHVVLEMKQMGRRNEPIVYQRKSIKDFYTLQRPCWIANPMTAIASGLPVRTGVTAIDSRRARAPKW